jgi:FG-GAP-like repeat
VIQKNSNTYINYSNCKVVDKNTPGSLLRVGITKGDSYYNSRDAYNITYTDYNKYNICGNKVNINGNYKEEGSQSISPKIAYTTCQKADGYYYTYFNSGKPFSECASSDGKTLDRSVIVEEYNIQYNSIMHHSNCQSKINWKDIIAEIKFDTDPSIINLCSKYTDRVLVESNQSINLNPFDYITPPIVPSTPSYPNHPGLLDSWQLQPSADFNNDGSVDVLWRNKVDGTLVLWYLNGRGNFLSGTNIPVAGDSLLVGVKVDPKSGWVISTIGDIDGDGNKDLIWHNTTSGDRVIWYLNTQRQIASGDVLPYPSKEWEVVASVDTNNDKKDDLIFRHKTSGHVVLWRSNRIVNTKGENEYQILGGALLTTFSDYNAQIYGAYQSQAQKGTEQYTIQWYYIDGPARGQKVEWYMNGLTFKSGTNDTSKSVAGVDYAGVR